MYVSRPVRAIRDDPVPGETVTLAITLASGDAERAVREAVTGRGGTVLATRQFDTLEVRVPHEAVSALCGLDGIEAAETAAAIGIEPGDAGEDVDSLPDGP